MGLGLRVLVEAQDQIGSLTLFGPETDTAGGHSLYRPVGVKYAVQAGKLMYIHIAGNAGSIVPVFPPTEKPVSVKSPLGGVPHKGLPVNGLFTGIGRN